MPRKPADLNGKTFGALTVERLTDQRDNHGYVLYQCRCSCGATVLVCAGMLKRGKTTRCHTCYLKSRGDLIGRRFGRLHVADIAPRPKGASTHTTYWQCKCDCGNECIVSRRSLLIDGTTSCGCNQRDAAKNMYVDGTAPHKLNESENPRSTNSSGVTGVWWDKSRQLWTAEIVLRRHKYNLGRYKDFAQAVAVRKQAEAELFAPIMKEHPEKIKKQVKKIIKDNSVTTENKN